MPRRSGQNGITCMRPTAPAGDTAQRSKRLSTSMTAMTRPGGKRASPRRCVSQYTCLRISRRSSFSLTMRRSRGSISVYQTAESYWSVKHCAWAIAFATTACSCGSRCWSARAGWRTAAPRAASAMTRSGRTRTLRVAGSGPETRAHEGERVVRGELGARAIASLAVFESAGIEAAIRHHQAVRDAQQLGIGELDARARVTVVVQDLDPGGGELGIQAVADFADTRGFLQVQGYQHYLEGRDRCGPDDAALIVVLLDGRGHDARHTDTVAAHVQGGFAARLIEHQRLHRLAVLAAQLEDVTHLDTARDLQSPVAGRAGVALDDVAQVRSRGAGHIPLPVHARQMHVLLVRAAHEVRECECAVIGIHAAIQSHQADVTGLRAGGLEDALRARHPQRARHALEPLRLEGDQTAITAQHQGHDLVPTALDNEGLHAARGVHLQEARELGDGARSEEHTSELQSQSNLVCRLLL